MNRFTDATAIILSGGKSSRMGSDKGLTFFRERRLVEYPISLLKSLFSKIIIVSNTDAYAQFGLPVFPDYHSEAGPLAGIYSGLSHSDTEKNLFIACDMPFVTNEIIQLLMNVKSAHDIIVPFHDNHPEPLCAVYKKSCMQVIEQQIMKKQFKVQEVFQILNVCRLEMDPEYFSQGNPFRNINTREELINFEKR